MLISHSIALSLLHNLTIAPIVNQSVLFPIIFQDKSMDRRFWKQLNKRRRSFTLSEVSSVYWNVPRKSSALLFVHLMYSIALFVFDLIQSQAFNHKHTFSIFNAIFDESNQNNTLHSLDYFNRSICNVRLIYSFAIYIRAFSFDVIDLNLDGE